MAKTIVVVVDKSTPQAKKDAFDRAKQWQKMGHKVVVKGW